MWRFRFILNLIRHGEISLVYRMTIQYLRKNLRLKIGSKFKSKSARSVKTYVSDKFNLLDLDKDFPLVSIVIPHVNYGRFLERAINSVSRSTLTNFEVIVLESGSDLENLALVKSVDEKNLDSRVAFDYGPRRKLGANRNLGVQKSRGLFVCSFDPDDELGTSYLEVALFNGISNCYDVSGAGMRVEGQETGVWEVPTRVTYRDLIHRNALPSNAIFTREIWQIAGGFVDSLPDEPHIHEDWRFWQRAALFGARIGNVNKPLTTIHIHGKNMSRQSDVLAEHIQAKLIRQKNSNVTLKRKDSNRLKDFSFRRNKRELISTQDVMLDFADRVLRPSDKQGPHILYFVPFIDQSGSTKVMTRIAKFFQSKDYRITFVATQTLPESSFGLDVDFETFILPNLLPNESWLTFVRHLIVSRKTTHVWQSGSLWLYENISQLTAQGITFVDSLYIPGSNHLKMSASLSKHFNYVFFESQNVLESYQEYGGTSSTKIISNGIDLPKRDKHLNFQERRYVTFLGRLAPEKDPKVFLDLVEIAQSLKEFSNCFFVMAGAGPLESHLEKEIERRRLRIRLLGHLKEPLNLLQESICLVLTSTTSEGRPNVLLEATAVGTPVIGFNVGGVSSIIQEGVNGYLVEQGDVTLILRRLVELVSHEEIWRELSSAALDMARTEFSWEPRLHDYLSALTEKNH